MKPETSLPSPPTRDTDELTQEAALLAFGSLIPESRSRKGQSSRHAHQDLEEDVRRGVRERKGLVIILINEEVCYSE